MARTDSRKAQQRRRKIKQRRETRQILRGGGAQATPAPGPAAGGTAEGA